MIIVLSPAKSFNYDASPHTKTHTLPDFIERSVEPIDVLRKLPPAQIDTLVHVSDPLAALDVMRYADWSPEPTTENSKQATLAFDGDVYGGLDANPLAVDDLQFTQEHLRILSGLYDVLCPLNWMQPHRLKAGTRLASPRGRDLYAFWGGGVTLALNELFRQGNDAALVNLMSEEYFRVVRPKVLRTRIIMLVLEDWKNDQCEATSFHARRVRNLMVRYVIEYRITGPHKLKTFNIDGYTFVATNSDDERWIFRRKLA